MALLFVLFIVVPILELYVIIQVGQAIGPLPTIGLLIVDSILGTMLMRSQGRAAWRRFNETLAAGRPPAREVLDGALVIFGGALLLTPGFLTDILGAVLLIPPSRALVRRILVASVLRRSAAGQAAIFMARMRPGRGRGPGAPPPPPAADYEGTATEIRDEPKRLP